MFKSKRSRNAAGKIAQASLPVMESFEDRILMAGDPAAPDAQQAIDDLVTSTVSGALSSVPFVGGGLSAAFGWALGMAGSDPATTHFNIVSQKIDTLTQDVASLKASVDSMSAKLDTLTRDTLINAIPFAEIQTAQQSFDNYINSSSTAERQAAKAQFLLDAAPLNVAINKIENAFKGTGGKTNLMEAFANVLKTSATTAPFLTNSSYTTPLQNVFAYYKDIEAQALNLLVEYDHAKGLNAAARNAANLAKADMTADEGTLPAPIPVYAVYDPRSGNMWSRFPTAPMSYYIAQHNFARLVSGDLTLSKYLYNNTARGKELEYYGVAAYDTQKAENARLGIRGFFTWSLPTPDQVGGLAAPDQSSADKIRPYLPSRGFEASVTNYQIWTSQVQWQQRIPWTSGQYIIKYFPENQRPSFGEVTQVYTSTIPGYRAGYGWFRASTSAQLATGIQAMYVCHVKHGYENARRI